MALVSKTLRIHREQLAALQKIVDDNPKEEWDVSKLVRRAVAEYLEDYAIKHLSGKAGSNMGKSVAAPPKEKEKHGRRRAAITSSTGPILKSQAG